VVLDVDDEEEHASAEWLGHVIRQHASLAEEIAAAAMRYASGFESFLLAHFA
jgi:hypothetical protein